MGERKRVTPSHSRHQRPVECVGLRLAVFCVVGVLLPALGSLSPVLRELRTSADGKSLTTTTQPQPAQQSPTQHNTTKAAPHLQTEETTQIECRRSTTKMETSSLAAFLRSAKAALPTALTEASGESAVVLGNEAADLDSVVSALVTAYASALTLTTHKENRSTTAPSLVLPVVNCPRDDLPLRTEVTYFLTANAIPIDDLICRDEIDLRALQGAGKLSLTLVDHNVLPECDAALTASIVKVIDHHKRDRPLDPRDIIEPVGSCATLVAQVTAGQFDSDPVVSNLLYGTILLDTVNLSATAQKATPKDFQAVAHLEEVLHKLLPSAPSRDDVYRPIVAARSNISSLTPPQLLRKDCKVLRTPEISIAIPAVPLLAQKFLELDGVTEALRGALRLNRVTALVVMGWEVGDGESDMRRDLAVFSDGIHKAKQVATPLENCEELRLKLIRQSCDSASSLFLYEQGNVGLSRKFILPFLATHFESKAQSQLETVDGLGSVELLIPPGDASPNKLSGANNAAPLVLPAISYSSAVHNLGVGDPISHGGSNQSSAYNSCPYTPQNSCAEPEDPYGPGETYFLPSFNSREMIEKIEMKRGKLRGYDKSEQDQLNVGANSYPFTPKNSYVDSSIDAYFSEASRAQQSSSANQSGGILNAIDSEVLLRKLLEKRRGDSASSNTSSKSQSLTKLNGAEGGDSSSSPVGDNAHSVSFSSSRPVEIPPRNREGN